MRSSPKSLPADANVSRRCIPATSTPPANANAPPLTPRPHADAISSHQRLLLTSTPSCRLHPPTSTPTVAQYTTINWGMFPSILFSYLLFVISSKKANNVPSFPPGGKRAHPCRRRVSLALPP
mmetsp:Transcript_9550/g.19434  ORF Transcript_9550/g.19434 Transcript_9550/m.19434 type:complete len:123 (+) Transcript_9550:306-674(+)